MNLLEIIEKAKDKGEDFEYKGVTFTFRPLTMKELDAFVALNKLAEEKAKKAVDSADSNYSTMATQIEHVMNLHPILGWKNMTNAKFFDIANRSNEDAETGMALMTEDELMEPVIFEPSKAHRYIHLLSGADDKTGDVKNLPFVTFFTGAVMDATTKRYKDEVEKKTI